MRRFVIDCLVVDRRIYGICLNTINKWIRA